MSTLINTEASAPATARTLSESKLTCAATLSAPLAPSAPAKFAKLLIFATRTAFLALLGKLRCYWCDFSFPSDTPLRRKTPQKNRRPPHPLFRDRMSGG